MGRPRWAGALWLIAGISSGAIAFFLVDPLDLAIFIGGAVMAILLGLGMLVRPSPSWVTWSNLLAAAWVLAFGAVILTSLSLPIEQLLSVVWILGFGVAAAVVAYGRRPRIGGA
jgi:DMSO/TMAO reductase YedYZ heme-binding membrane subunit